MIYEESAAEKGAYLLVYNTNRPKLSQLLKTFFCHFLKSIRVAALTRFFEVVVSGKRRGSQWGSGVYG